MNRPLVFDLMNEEKSICNSSVNDADKSNNKSNNNSTNV